MNRQQRRAAKKASPKKKPAPYTHMTKEERITALVKNGITPKDLEKSYNDGYNQARKELTRFEMRMFYCACGLALRDLFKFGEERIIRVLDRIQQIMTEEICTDDIAERLQRETGIDIFDTDYDN